jgi:hypothetical protein
MLLMAGERPLQFPSFWRLQAAGWICLYVLVLVACIPDLFQKPGVLRDSTVSVAFMFLGSFVLHPVCRSLLRRSPSWLAFEFRISAWSLAVGTVSSLPLVQSVLQH